MPPSREWNSAVYQRVSNPQFVWGEKVLARLSLRGDETVLDAGCGTGRLTAQLLRKLPNGKVVGVDLSQNMLRTARQELAPELADRMHFVVADLQHLPFDGTFDGIFSTAAFHWVPDHEQLFRSLYQALRPGGWLVAQAGGGPNLARFHARVAALSASSEFAPLLAHFHDAWVFSDAATAAERLKSAGFISVNTSVEPAPTSLDNAEKYREFIAHVILHRRLELIPDAFLRDRFLQELSRHAAADDPPFELDYWRLNLDARKP